MAPLWEAPGNSLAEYPTLNTAVNEPVAVAEGAGYLEDAVRITCTTTSSNEIGVRADQLGFDGTVLQFRFCIEEGATFTPSAVHNLLHVWSNTAGSPFNQYAQDLLELRLVTTDNTHFKFRLLDIVGSNAIQTGATVFEVGRWYKVIIYVKSTLYQLFIDDATTAEINWTGRSSTTYKVTAFSFGKFYSQVLNGSILLDTAQTYKIIDTSINNWLKNHECVDGWFQRYRVPGKPGQAAIVRNYSEGLDGSYQPAPDIVSESNAYGMHLALRRGNRTYFDELEQFNYYVLERRNQPGSLPGQALMCWHWDNLGGAPFDQNFATDGDLDRLENLWEAHSKWGSDGTINYRARARSIERDLLAYGFKKIDGKLYLIDNYYSKGNDPGDVNLSYISFTAFRRARQETSNQEWDQAVDGGYKMMIERQNASSAALFPNWSQVDNTGTTSGPAGYRDDNFTYDAIRCLWRLFRDWVFEADIRAYNLLANGLYGFLSTAWNSGAGSIKAEYNKSGTAISGPYENILMYAMDMLAFYAVSATSTQGDNIYNNKVINTFTQHPGGSYWGTTKYYDAGLVAAVIYLKEGFDKNEGYFTRTHSQAFVQ